MTTYQPVSEPVISIDLRDSGGRYDSGPELRAEVLRQRGGRGPSRSDRLRFLVVDTPAGLAGNRRAYERIRRFPGGSSVHLVCLLVGDAPEQGERVLLKPDTLRSAAGTCGLLWAGDLHAAHGLLDGAAPDDPSALAPLRDLLRVPDLFDAVLEQLTPLNESVAAPAVRLLEQQLDPQARDRAWRGALTQFAGGPAEGAGGGWAEVPAEQLPKPLADLVPGQTAGGRGHRVPGGEADRAYRDCTDALDGTATALLDLARITGLVGTGALLAFEAEVTGARRALDGYRELVTGVLSVDTSPTGPGSAATLELFRHRGLQVAPSEGAGEGIGDGLRRLAERLLGDGLSVRGTAQRFTALSGRIAPVPGSTLLPALARYGKDKVAGLGPRRGGPRAALEPGGWRAPACLAAGLLGGLWAWPLTLLALLVPALVLGSAVLARRRLAGATGDGARLLGGGALVGAVLGGAGGAVLHPPLWVGAIGVLLGLVLALTAVVTGWRDAVHAWGGRSGTAAVQEALDGLDQVLARAVREHWAARARSDCADAAGAVAGVLRAAADEAYQQAVGAEDLFGTAEAFGTAGAAADPDADEAWLSQPSAPGEFGESASDDFDYDYDPDESWAGTDPIGPASAPQPGPGQPAAPGSPVDDWAQQFAWGNGSDPSAPGAAAAAAPTPGAAAPTDPDAPPPPWLDRDSGLGGPALVSTLAGDLTDAVITELASYWGTVERGESAAAAQQRVGAQVRAMLARARAHLRENDVAAPPSAGRQRVRPGTSELQGLSLQRLVQAAGPDADPATAVPLVSAEQEVLLNRDPEMTVWLRFAPAAVQPQIEQADRATGGTGTAVWLSSGRYAGLLGLVPLRGGAVRSVRTLERGPGDLDTDGPTDGPSGGHPDEGDEW
ncbi:hypothetical protein ABUW04_26335 [Streptacidiphilus sp. N1-10]|uniref:Uncharacterized protein n=1 Tax=Streptacidiphilus jeojiensis TaxID=3229225 RepID=A0ABV6XU44_9ACTN